jgi:Domain of unknown function (DUF4124)
MLVIQARWRFALLLIAVQLATVHAADPGASRQFYRWVDKQGQVHYGDQIPQEYSGAEHQVVNSQGVEVDRREAQKTPEQVARDEKRAREQLLQHEHDVNLLSSYVSVEEIERLRDQRLQLVSDQIRVTSQFLETLNARQQKLTNTSMKFAPYSTDPKAPRMPDDVTEDLVSTSNNIRVQQQNLKQKRTEQDTMNKEFAADIDRFKALKGIH